MHQFFTRLPVGAGDVLPAEKTKKDKKAQQEYAGQYGCKAKSWKWFHCFRFGKIGVVEREGVSDLVENAVNGVALLKCSRDKGSPGAVQQDLQEMRQARKQDNTSRNRKR